MVGGTVGRGLCVVGLGVVRQWADCESPYFRETAPYLAQAVWPGAGSPAARRHGPPPKAVPCSIGNWTRYCYALLIEFQALDKAQQQ